MCPLCPTHPRRAALTEPTAWLPALPPHRPSAASSGVLTRISEEDRDGARVQVDDLGNEASGEWRNLERVDYGRVEIWNLQEIPSWGSAPQRLADPTALDASDQSAHISLSVSRLSWSRSNLGIDSSEEELHQPRPRGTAELTVTRTGRLVLLRLPKEGPRNW